MALRVKKSEALLIADVIDDIVERMKIKHRGKPIYLTPSDMNEWARSIRRMAEGL